MESLAGLVVKLTLIMSFCSSGAQMFLSSLSAINKFQ